MCGIAGIWDYKEKIDEKTVALMRDTLIHRGPDDKGIYLDKSGHLALAHRRLSIIDLSPLGHQPMERDGLVVTFNGEIYNFVEIRKELEALGANFTSHSDTEVLLLAFKQWGESAVHKFRGMFAFGLWDREQEKLTLYRDRAGVKPLYYYKNEERFIFASELRAIMAHPKVKKEIDLDALANFIQLGRIPAPMSILKNVYKLEAGHSLLINKDGVITKKKYWDITDFVNKEVDPDYDEGKTMSEMESILEESFNLRMVSDVPVGVFLSGGVDSSLVTALIQKNTKIPVNTFTIGFKEGGYDEAGYAREVARHLGTNHHELYLTPDVVREIIPKLPDIYDEPFGDASALPTFFVSEFARSKVTVALSSDGGDELFCGYGDRYKRMADAYKKCAKIPKALSILGQAILPFVGKSPRLELLFSGASPARIYAALQNDLSDKQVRRLIVGNVSKNFGATYWKHFDSLEGADPASQFQWFDFKANLPNSILVKVDRASMAVSLEGRDPFFDQRIMEYAASFPLALKQKSNKDKYVLKEILYKYIPRDLVDRRKHGFSVPIELWLKNDLKYLLDEYLADERIKKDGIFNPKMVREEREKFLSGQSGVMTVWNLIVFQMWKERWGL